MKKLSEIAWNVSEAEYRASSAFHYSMLSRFHKEGFHALEHLNDKISSPSLTFGSMVDSILTGGMDEFNDRFAIVEAKAPKDKLFTIVTSLMEEYGELYNTMQAVPDVLILGACNIADYYSTYKDATRISKVREGCTEYYNAMLNCGGKTVVSLEMYNKAVECVETLRNDPMTSNYFSGNVTLSGIERFFQLKFKGEHEGHEIVCMVDELLVDHTRKIIYPIDLKTSGMYEDEFYQAFIKYAYYIQAQLYWYIVRQNMDKDDFYKDYKLADMRFIVINKESLRPLVWNYSDTQAVNDCAYGSKGQIVCRNWRGILKDLSYYLSENPRYQKGIQKLNSITAFLNRL